MTNKAPSEAEKMQRVPGIIFADGAVGRRARIAGTGIDVFEVIKEFLACDRDRQALAEGFDWLTPKQLDSALAYYTVFPKEIDERLKLEAMLTPDVIRAKYPWPEPQPRTAAK